MAPNRIEVVLDAMDALARLGSTHCHHTLVVPGKEWAAWLADAAKMRKHCDSSETWICVYGPAGVLFRIVRQG